MILTVFTEIWCLTWRHLVEVELLCQCCQWYRFEHQAGHVETLVAVIYRQSSPQDS